MASIKKVCYKLPKEVAFMNNYGWTHVYYHGPMLSSMSKEEIEQKRWLYCRLSVILPRCRFFNYCLICGAADCIEVDPDQRLMPHDWTDVPFFSASTVPWELYCDGCKALWDPVPEGKVKL